MNRYKELGDYLHKHHLTLATAESCTAGKIMAVLADQGDAGDSLFMGYVVYNVEAKKRELGVKQETIDEHTLTPAKGIIIRSKFLARERGQIEAK